MPPSASGRTTRKSRAKTAPGDSAITSAMRASVSPAGALSTPRSVVGRTRGDPGAPPALGARRDHRGPPRGDVDGDEQPALGEAIDPAAPVPEPPGVRSARVTDQRHRAGGLVDARQPLLGGVHRRKGT